MGLFDKRKKVSITGINISLQGVTHKLEGIESRGETVELRIPFKNKAHTNMLTEAGIVKPQEIKPIIIKALKVSDPFTLLEAAPKTPVEVKSGESVEFKVSLGAPKYNYTGPLSITLETVDEEVVHLEFTKTILVYKGKRVEVESSARLLTVQKGGIFIESVQLYKAVSFGEMVKVADLDPPFKLSGTDPNLPVKMDTPNSYLMAFYIQAPPHNYSGELVINLQ